MPADISRDTFAVLRDRHYLRVLLQQGRPLIDADFNEQVANLLHYIETLAADLIGPYGGPKNNLGFKLIDEPKDIVGEPENRREKLEKLLEKNDFLLSAGRYYVDGVLCENPSVIGYSEQLSHDALKADTQYLVYLDVWERHITHWEDRQLDADPRLPGILEVALGGVDTTTRTRVEWQVRTVAAEGVTQQHLLDETHDEWLKLLRDHKVDVRPGTGRLKAQTDPQGKPGAPELCIQPPDAGYRGPENLLCRVEIHQRGTMEEGASYKVSFMNGSVIFPIRSTQGTLVTLANLGHSGTSGLAEGDWVEAIEDGDVLRGAPGVLCKVIRVDQDTGEVTLNKAPHVVDNPARHPLLRRWDTFLDSKTKQKTCEAKVQNGWLNIGYGIQLWFETEDPLAVYCTGDYWLIPARTATGDIEWPLSNDNKPLALLPQGVEHHYAPLALIKLDANGKITKPDECLKIIEPIAKKM